MQLMELDTDLIGNGPATARIMRMHHSADGEVNVLYPHVPVVTVYGWMLYGQTVPAMSRVICEQMQERWYVVAWEARRKS